MSDVIANVEATPKNGAANGAPAIDAARAAHLAKLEAEVVKYRTAFAVLPHPPLKLDLGCGTRKREGFVGVDERQFPGVDLVADLKGIWPWPDNSVDEIHCSHALEHLPATEIDFKLEIDWETRSHKLTKVVTHPRVHFFNELYRVMKTGSTALFFTPHWASERAYGDVSHEWPPVVPFFWAYLDKVWRAANAPHLGFVCDFTHQAIIHVAPSPFLQGRNHEFLEKALSHGINTGSDMQCTLTKVVRP